MDFSEQIYKLRQINFAQPQPVNFSSISLKLNGYPFLFTSKILDDADENTDITHAGLIKHNRNATEGLGFMGAANGAAVIATVLLSGITLGSAIFGTIFAFLSRIFGTSGLISLIIMAIHNKRMNGLKLIEIEMNKYFNDAQIKKMSQAGTWFNLDKKIICYELIDKDNPFNISSYKHVCKKVEELQSLI